MSSELSPAQVLALYPPHAETITSLLRTRCAVAPAQTVLVIGERHWSFRQLEEASTRLAGVLAHRGLVAGARLALIAPNSDLSVLLFLAVARLRALFIPLNPGTTDEELGFLLRHARAHVIVSQEADAQRARALAPVAGSHPVHLTLSELGVEAVAVEGVIERIASLAGGASAATLAEPQPADAAVVIYTSGTTGFPKGVVHTHRSYVLAAEGFVARLYLQPSERLLTVMPFYHINALFYSLGGAIAAGATLITTASFSASRFWSLAAQTGATQFNFLAAVGNILINRPRTEFVPEHRIRKIYGGPISARMEQVFAEEFGVPDLIEGYGMSEIPGACCNPFQGPRKPGSIGKPAVHPRFPGDFAELRIEDDEGNVLPVGATGELTVRTPMIFKEYLDDPKQTAAAFRDGWFLTGDLARCDADGYFYFIARKKDIIRRRGENISGAELDRVISDHPGVIEAAAIGVPSELGEEEILVVVVAKREANLHVHDILEWCRGRLAPMKLPRYVVFADSLPHTPSHRVAKHRLKSDATLLGRAVDTQPTRPA
jgi:crotonobetaine/carnitine-CoA ligase